MAPVRRAARHVYPNLTWTNLGEGEIAEVMRQLKLNPRLGEEDNV
jgi:hypothetical protein